VKLHNRIKESSLSPLDNPHSRPPRKPNSGRGLSRDRKARIVDMLVDLKHIILAGMLADAINGVDTIIKEVER
jgi:hypothetical protein